LPGTRIVWVLANDGVSVGFGGRGGTEAGFFGDLVTSVSFGATSAGFRVAVAAGTDLVVDVVLVGAVWTGVTAGGSKVGITATFAETRVDVVMGVADVVTIAVAVCVA
jgi:hypothetical protein